MKHSKFMKQRLRITEYFTLTIFLGLFTLSQVLGCEHENKTASNQESSNHEEGHDKHPTKENVSQKADAKQENKIALLPDILVTNYIQLKNSLTSDNGKGAATAASSLIENFEIFDQKKLNSEQLKAYIEITDNAIEMAEHISKNENKIEHQREHFAMLSRDMYDLVKLLGSSQPLFKDFCPMADEKRGAIWLSEIKEIKNPYFGKKMLSCGSVKGKIE